ncbi:MAG: hypothetical protein LC746_02165 [Acidobacteria bacterium]|nr:hypothetical protein [Acidobacteriota bacterium]
MAHTSRVGAAALRRRQNPLNPLNNFNSLSLLDLLEARDLYHLHLTERKGVIATAIGRYLIRKGDPEPGEEGRKGTGAKSLENTEIRRYSWPCVLVFVERWIDEADIRKEGYKPTDMVPSALHMPNGKVVPVCVVEAPRDPVRHEATTTAAFPKTFIGGGYPVIADVQGEQHVASIGCLLTDGHLTYALTNRHVAGEPGETLYSLLGGARAEIGWSSEKQLGRLLFKDVYTGWPGQNVYVNADVGLIEVKDKNRWTPQVYSVGVVDQLADVSIENLSLQLVNARVRAYGCVSHEMFGRIWALFYRYKSVGGFEYVSDVFIGPRAGGKFQTHPGDSGTLWLLEPPDEDGGDGGGGDVREDTAQERPANDARYRLVRRRGAREKKMLQPIAVQWGGHVFTDAAGARRQSYALATLLSTVCERLEVDLIRDWGQALPEYWGTIGHFTIANMACQIVGKPSSKLRRFFGNNLLNLTFKVDEITDAGTKGLSKQDFVPLADVPDLVWKSGRYQRGPRGDNPEAPNHFADMDERPPGGGATLLELCKQDPSSHIVPDFWIQHARQFPPKEGKSKDTAKDMGLLPFRVWQIFDEMVRFVRAGDAVSFLCAAGTLAHYVGDACQPLHISYLHHGNPDQAHQVTRMITHAKGKNAGKTEPLNESSGVHEDYEQNMFKGASGEEMKQQLRQSLGGGSNGAHVAGGREAARRTVAMMQSTFDRVKPARLVKFYDDALKANKSKSEILGALWDKFGKDTVAVMSDGCRLLALLWESAWAEGVGDQKIKTLTELDRGDLVACYKPRTFLTSYLLTEIGAHLKGLNGSAAGTHQPAAATKPATKSGGKKSAKKSAGKGAGKSTKKSAGKKAAKK